MSGSAETIVEHVITLDENNHPMGSCEKLEAHSEGGVRHLAFSILLWNETGEVLLQRRARAKYHFAGLWSNTCCGHPRPGEEVVPAGRRRLHEEFGVDVELRSVDTYSYKAFDEQSGLTENEFVHVLSGHLKADPDPDPDEIGEYRWATPEKLRREVARDPEAFTPWFRTLVNRLEGFAP